MTTTKIIQDAIRDAYQAVAGQYRKQLQASVAKNELPENWFRLWWVLEYEPEPATVAKMHLVVPYENPSRIEDNLNELVEAGGLAVNDKGEYRLTDDIREKLLIVIADLNNHLETLHPLPLDDLNRLADYMRRFVEQAVSQAEPAEKYYLLRNRTSQPDESYGPMPNLVQYFSDHGPFRDDCHLASWRALDVPGNVWETLGFLWGDNINTAEGILEQRPNRGYTVEDYEAAFQQLVEKGWVKSGADGYEITAEGQRIRDEAEEATNRPYDEAWNTLSTAEIDDLLGLLTALSETLTVAEPA